MDRFAFVLQNRYAGAVLPSAVGIAVSESSKIVHERSSAYACCACRYVQEIADDHIIVQLASIVKGRVSIFDSAEEPQALKGFAERFKEGQAIKCRISQVAHSMLVSCTCVKCDSRQCWHTTF